MSKGSENLRDRKAQLQESRRLSFVASAIYGHLALKNLCDGTVSGMELCCVVLEAAHRSNIKNSLMFAVLW